MSQSSPSRREPLFILCPGRSFSSVVCAILGQHPQCYGLPELNLFLGDTLGEAMKVYASGGRSGFAGLRRTIAQIHSGAQTEATVEEAETWIRANLHLTPRQLLDHISEAVGDRILVEKSPTNVIDPSCLTRVVRTYPKANYLQLLRHPRSRGKSQMAARVQKREGKKIRQLMTRVTGEKTGDYEGKWTQTHLMLHDIGRQMPVGQMMRLHGETLLRDLQHYLPQICEWLDIRSDAEAIAMMLHPEESPYSSIGPANAQYGANRGFLTHPELDLDRLAKLEEATLDAPMEWAPERHFGPDTRLLASYYGYR